MAHHVTMPQNQDLDTLDTRRTATRGQRPRNGPAPLDVVPAPRRHAHRDVELRPHPEIQHVEQGLTHHTEPATRAQHVPVADLTTPGATRFPPHTRTHLDTANGSIHPDVCPTGAAHSRRAPDRPHFHIAVPIEKKTQTPVLTYTARQSPTRTT